MASHTAAVGRHVPAVVKEAAIAAGVAAALGFFMVGFKTTTSATLETRFFDLAVAVVVVFLGRLGFGLVRQGTYWPAVAGGIAGALGGWLVDLPTQFLSVVVISGGIIIAVTAAVAWARGAGVFARALSPLAKAGSPLAEAVKALPNIWRILAAVAIAFAILLPFMPFADRRLVDIGILVMTYIMLGWGLNIVVGLAGLLDLGYVAFYAVGAYSYALLAQYFGLGFWTCLPLAGVFAAMFGVVLGFPVLRLRGDYLAIVTLGFGEMIRVVLLNWVKFTNGPDGISGIPRPSFFGMPFKRRPPEGTESFHQFFGLDYTSLHRIIFLYYVILLLALITNFFTVRMRRLPLGRAWEALREDEIACRSLGINPTNTKLTAFSIGAMFGGFAGSFFATRQGFISPESFSFLESAIILAIVVLGGMGSQFGVVIAAFVLIGLPEWFRELQEYRMLAFGAGMVLIMIWRPRGLLAHRDPTIRLGVRS